MDKLNIGCGKNWEKNYPNYEGLDIIDFGQEYVADVFEFLDKQTRDESYDEIMANHFLEHFTSTDIRIMLNEIHRILKPGGILKIVVPEFRQEGAYSLVHKTLFSERTFRLLEDEEFCKTYGFKLWQIESLVVNDRPDVHAWLKKPE